MAEVTLGTVYKVSITEHDMGVQRVDPDDTKFFTTLDEAEAYARDVESLGSRECYWRADITRIS